MALDEPVAEVATALRQATGHIDDALRQGFTPDANNVDRWLQIALIGADPASAAELGARIEAGIEGFSERSEVVAWYVAGVLALLRGQADAARAAATALTQWLDVPATSPRTVAGYGALGELIAATAAADQAAFDDAANARSEVMADAFGGSVELRRHPDGLLDALGAPVARLATLRGLNVAAGEPYLAAELLAAVAWPTGGG